MQTPRPSTWLLTALVALAGSPAPAQQQREPLSAQEKAAVLMDAETLAEAARSRYAVQAS